ncbi:hypothetical protein LINPERHAP1_LOCUS18312 [Linum perenne]
MEHLVEDELANTSMLLEWMNTNRTDPEARHISFLQGSM